ncbi:hypothetical protein A2U01_0018915, partial [Trifolium medium]|nr:hypothetical protein [Trifolium medium]
KEMDDARAQVTNLGPKLTETQRSYEVYQEKYALQATLVSDLEKSEEQVVSLSKDKRVLVLVSDMLKRRVQELQEELKARHF